MFCITLETKDPYFNLAIEEFLLKKSNNEYLILGINSPSVIIGKHQTAHKEVNTRFVSENAIPVIRRISGGGAVYHDEGNLNFTFIRQSEAGKQIDFRKYTLPVIEFLKSIGVQATFEGKNDIKVEGLKISGNAEHVHRNRVLHHGTLLFNASLEVLRNALRKDKSSYISRSVESNPASVTNLIEIVTRFKDIDNFRSEMMDFLLKSSSDMVNYKLSPSEINDSELLANDKYKGWEWNYAYGPEYIFKNMFQIKGKNHSCKLFVVNGVICESNIEGSDEMVNAGKKLTGCRHMVRDFWNLFYKEGIFISNEEIYNFF
jgi:lipoate-protein ligase A